MKSSGEWRVASDEQPILIKRPRRKLCVRIDSELYTEFRHACIDLGTTVTLELEDCVVRKLQAWTVKNK